MSKLPLVVLVLLPVVPLTCDFIGDTWDGFRPIKVDGKYGYLDDGGREVVPPQFDELGICRDGLAPAMRGGDWGYIDKTGRVVIPPKYSGREKEFSDGLARVIMEHDKEGLIDRHGTEYWED